MHITGPQSALELVLLLLLHDVAHSDPSICILSLDSSVTEGWKLKLHIAREEVSTRSRSSVHTHTHANRVYGLPHNVNDELDRVVHAHTHIKPQPHTHTLIPSGLHRRPTSSFPSSSEGYGYVYGRSLSPSPSHTHSCLTHLADTISKKVMQEGVYVNEIDVCEGYGLQHTHITLKNDVFSCLYEAHRSSYTYTYPHKQVKPQSHTHILPQSPRISEGKDGWGGSGSDRG
ncbi:hypothetical protein EON63_23280, partial [archaeon]